MAVDRSTALQVADVSVPRPDAALIGSDWRELRGGAYEVISPTTEDAVATVTLPSTEDVRDAVELASEAGRANWSTLPVSERVEVCRRFAEAIESRLDEANRIWAAEAGMPIRYSKTFHRFAAVGAWNSALEAAEAVLAPRERTSMLGYVQIWREPAGVVAAIMAYNGPLPTIGTKVIPALLAGCPVVVKAAVESQLIMRLVSECAVEAGFPAGALSIFCGGVDVGAELTAHPLVDMVSLTGGRNAAQAVVDATQERFARTHLELGGKSPALILEDADLDQSLRSLVPAATSGTGQVCAALSRVLAPRSRYEEVVERLAEAFGALKVGDPLDPEVQIGPLSTAAARERAEAFVGRATEEGARVVVGGKRPAGLDVGWFYEPTLIADVAPEAHLSRNEVFGPVTAVIGYEDLEDGVRLANDTSYGLAATVYTGDHQLGVECASRIQSGSVAINTFGPTVSEPFGGVKGSGWGREAGPEGILEFTEIKQVLFGRD